MLLYTETAFHHEGDFDYLISLIDASREAGADGVKFQILTQADNLISTRNSGYDTLSQYVFSTAQWRQAFDYAVQQGLKLIAMPLDLPAFGLMDDVAQHIAYQEVHPVCLNDKPLLAGVKTNGLPVIIGIGGRTVEEVGGWINYFGPQLAVLMCGFQAFPSRLEDVKLDRIPWLRSLFPELTIGYADHSGFADPNAVDSNDEAWRLGARLFEKHITSTEGVQRVDYESAVSAAKIGRIVSNLQALAAQGLTPPEHTGDSAQLAEMTEAERNYRKRTKVAVARCDLAAGQTLAASDLALKMIDKDGGFFDIDDLIGRTLAADISADDIISSNDLVSA